MKRKNLIFMLLIGVIALMTYGCSFLENDDQKTSIGPDGNQSAVADSMAQLAEFEAQSARYELWVGKMDPYVTKTESGEYVFDEAEFTAQYGLITGSDKTIVHDLKGSIPIANQKIQELSESGVAAKIWFKWYWWGYKECYSQLSAEYMLEFMNSVTQLKPFWAWAKYYHYYYGYFCINHSWAGGIWITL